MRANSVCGECAVRVHDKPLGISQLSELFPTVLQDGNFFVFVLPDLNVTTFLALSEATVTDNTMMSISFRAIHWVRVMLDQYLWLMGQLFVATKW
jgi:hypothetical protein